MTAGNGVMETRRSVRNTAGTSLFKKVTAMKPRDTSASVGHGCSIPMMKPRSTSGRYPPPDLPSARRRHRRCNVRQHPSALTSLAMDVPGDDDGCMSCLFTNTLKLRKLIVLRISCDKRE